MAPKLLDHRGRPMASDPARTAFSAASPALPQVAGWTPLNRSGDGERVWERDQLVARARDLFRNSGPMRAAARKKADMVVGAGWSLTANPDADALGVAPAEARALGRQLARAWRRWAEDPAKRCHAQRSLTFSAMLWTLYLEMQVSGEALAVMGYERRPHWPFGARVFLVDADRLSNPAGEPDSARMHGGIEFDDAGAAVAYHIRQAHPYDPWPDNVGDRMTWERVPRETAWGRPVVIHAYERDRVEQSRGTPPVAAVMGAFKQLERYADAELSRALVNALFVAFISSGFDPETAAEMLGPVEQSLGGQATASWQAYRSDFYASSPVHLGLDGARIPVMPPGDKIEMNAVQAQSGGFKEFEEAFLRRISAALEISYPQLAEDWGAVNYSSARAALNEIWRGVRRARARFCEDVVAPMYYAVVEEAVHEGLVELPAGAPDFWEQPQAYLRAQWTGPGRGNIDPRKEAEAAQISLETGLTTLAQEAAERGVTLEDIFAQLAREDELRAEHGLPPRAPAPSGAARGAVPYGDDGDDEEGENEP